MEMPDGQILTYHSHPDIPLPSKEDILWLNRARTENVGTLIDKRTNAPKSAVIRKPRDYDSTALTQPVDRKLPFRRKIGG
jgi:hypothetical protein